MANLALCMRECFRLSLIHIYYIEHRQQSKFFNVSEKALNFVCLLSIPLMVYFLLFAKEGILFLSGTAYLPAILPMQIIMPTPVSYTHLK